MIFDQQAAWVRDYDMQNDPGKWPEWWSANGISAVFLQAHSQETVVPTAQLVRWANACHAAGMDVCLWGSNGFDPEGDVRRIMAARAALSVPVRGVVAEVERYVKPNEPDTLSARYVTAFRGQASLRWMPLAVCVQADCGPGLNHAVWQNNRAYFAPECYWNQSASYEPAACIGLQHKQGWPNDRIKPVFGVWGDAGNGDKRAFDYLFQTAGLPIKGVSWYAGITLQELDLHVASIMRRVGMSA